MAQGQPGADSLSPVTADLVAAAVSLYGATPAFWGRYFTSAATAGSGEYHHATESAPLNSAGVRLLPVARQTTHVAGSAQQGSADGAANAQDFISTFGVDALTDQGGAFYMFLDVEGNPAAGSPSMTVDYYTGWAQGLARQAETLSGGHVRLLPCLYAAHGDAATFQALQTAMQAGASCHGAWIARYLDSLVSGAMGDWNDRAVSPAAPSPFPVPILAWQYAQNCLAGQIDCSQTNPAIDLQNDLLQYLVLPPP